MFPFPVQWDKIKDKEGDDIVVSLTRVEQALLIAAMVNIQAIGERAPASMSIGEDTDNFDAVTSGLLGKIAGV